MVKKAAIHIPLEELTRISFACDHCRTMIIVDINDAEQRKYMTASQKQCPICEYRIKSTIFVAFASYIRWFDEARAADQKVEFIIDQDSN